MASLERVTFGYAPGAPVFDGFSWEMQRGEAWAVLGPSGCGKTTLLYLLAGLQHPQSGLVRLAGAPLRRPRPETGLILQDYGLLPWATVRQNASLGLEIRRFYGPDGKHAPPGEQGTLDVDALLERLGLADVRDQYPHQVSGGQRQRTAIARTLALRPDLLLMDEPFASLDAPTRESLQRLAMKLRREQGLTLLTVTHAIEEAAVMGERVLLLGRPPNRRPQVVENPSAGREGYRDSPEYTAMCRLLRSRVEAL